MPYLMILYFFILLYMYLMTLAHCPALFQLYLRKQVIAIFQNHSFGNVWPLGVNKPICLVTMWLSVSDMLNPYRNCDTLVHHYKHVFTVEPYKFKRCFHNLKSNLKERHIFDWLFISVILKLLEFPKVHHFYYPNPVFCIMINGDRHFHTIAVKNLLIWTQYCISDKKQIDV